MQLLSRIVLKIFALEANNDLRLDTEWRSAEGAINWAYSTIKRDLKNSNNSYFKRAVRSNELFFVIKISELYHQDNFDKIIGEFP